MNISPHNTASKSLYNTKKTGKIFQKFVIAVVNSVFFRSLNTFEIVMFNPVVKKTRKRTTKLAFIFITLERIKDVKAIAPKE